MRYALRTHSRNPACSAWKDSGWIWRINYARSNILWRCLALSLVVIYSIGIKELDISDFGGIIDTPRAMDRKQISARGHILVSRPGSTIANGGRMYPGE